MLNFIKYIINKFLFFLTKCRVFYYNYKYYKYGCKYKGNKLIILKDGKEKTYKLKPYISKIAGVIISGNNNTLYIEYPYNTNDSKINFQGDNNTIRIGAELYGKYSITCFANNAKVKLGRRVQSVDFTIGAMDGDEITIGDNCMISDDVFLMTDGHSVVDAKTRELLNVPPYKVEIGNHVWIGHNVSILKGAKIPDCCIVAMNATVTKKFEEPNCVIAGCPANVVKHGIDWNGAHPWNYDKKVADINF